MRKLFKILSILLIIIVLFAAGGFIYLQVAFPKVGPAPDIKVESTPERLDRGKYLANGFAGCIECHSTRDFSKFSGPVVPGTEGKAGMDINEGAGFVPARNITQDKETGIGNWTDGEIFRAITAGVDKNGRFLAPMMPYPFFAKLDKEDIYSIIAYIKTLPPIKNNVPEKKLNFPVNIIFRTIPKDANEFGKFPGQDDRVKLGEYYAVSCKFCHSPNEKGEFLPGKLFSGGVEFPMPDGTIIRSANISPDKETGIGNLSKELFIQKFKMHLDPANLDVQKRGYNTPMPWSQFATGCSEEDLGAVYDYIMTQNPVKNKVEKIRLQGVN
ncbi:MAG TPA: cytochrome c [Ignavibacteria bacterium]|jgi:mono/diheme cytochrome c family protein